MPFPNIISQPHTTFRGRFLSVPTFLSFAVAGAFLVFLVTRFDINLGATWDSLKESNPLYFALAVVIHYTTFFFRGARWRLLLENAQQDAQALPPRTLHCTSLVLLGWFVNSVTWFRLGDAYRAYTYSSDTRGSFPRTVGTVLAERVLDMTLVVFLLAFATLLLVASGVSTPWVFVGLAAILAAILAGAILVMGRFRSTVSRFLPGRIDESYQRFHDGTLRSFRHQLPLVTLLGLLGWMAEVGRLLFVTEALGIPLRIPLIIFVTLASSMLTLVPITPGGLGAVEWGVTGLLMLSSKIETETVAFSIIALDRSISWLSILAVGAIVLLGREMLKGRRRRAARFSGTSSTK